jgi:LPS O-antigen subunit length determinant protein (WzzB/FepE family)
MTEKEIPMSSTPYQVQNSKYEPDEINLLDLLKTLVEKKVLIFSTASVFVVLSILYAFLPAVTYRASIGFQPPNKSLISFFPTMIYEILPNTSRNKDGTLAIKKNYMLYKFIAELQSYSNQEKVFNAGKFHERFVVNNPEGNMKGIVQEIHRSFHVILQEEHSKKKAAPPKVATFEMKGVKPELASDFLNALADFAKSKAVFDIKESIQNGIKNLKTQTSAELNYLISVERLNYESRIKIFRENLTIAKNLGILENNFANFRPATQSRDQIKELKQEFSNVSIWPTWYLYGQRALEQELSVMEHRNISHKTIDRIALDSKIAFLSNIDLSEINLAPVIISQTSIPPVDPINIKKINVIAIGIASGLFIGILIPLLSYLTKQAKER